MLRRSNGKPGGCPANSMPEPIPGTPGDGLAAYGDDGHDLMMTLARKIVSGKEDAETSVRPSRRAAEVKVMIDEFPQAQVPGEGGRQEQAGIGHQAMVVKEDAGYGRVCSVAASIGCSLFPGGFLFQNHYPRFRGAPSSFFKGCPQGRPSVDSGLDQKSRGIAMAMKSSKRLTRLLPRDNYLCGIHVSGCGKPIRNKKDATVDHIFTKSFFKDREDGVEPKHYNKDWNLQPMHQECNNDRHGQIYGFPLFHLFLPLASDRQNPERACFDAAPQDREG